VPAQYYNHRIILLCCGGDLADGKEELGRNNLERDDGDWRKGWEFETLCMRVLNDWFPGRVVPLRCGQPY
jgi:hypothetical protein